MRRFIGRQRRRFGRAERQGAVVIGRWADDTALLRLDDRTTREVQVPEELHDRVDVGSRATAGPDRDDVEWGLASERPARRGRFWQRIRG